jgi:hypothetical protein
MLWPDFTADHMAEALADADLARPVFTILGAAPDALQWSLRPGGHEMRADDWAAIDAL